MPLSPDAIRALRLDIEDWLVYFRSDGGLLKVLETLYAKGSGFRSARLFFMDLRRVLRFGMRQSSLFMMDVWQETYWMERRYTNARFYEYAAKMRDAEVMHELWRCIQENPIGGHIDNGICFNETLKSGDFAGLLSLAKAHPEDFHAFRKAHCATNALEKFDAYRRCGRYAKIEKLLGL